MKYGLIFLAVLFALYPVIFGEEYEQEFGGIYYILPEGCEYTILHEAPDGYQYHHIPFDRSAYDWSVFW